MIHFHTNAGVDRESGAHKQRCERCNAYANPNGVREAQGMSAAGAKIADSRDVYF